MAKLNVDTSVSLSQSLQTDIASCTAFLQTMEMFNCIHLFWVIIITGLGTLSFMKSGLWGSGKPIHANAALTKSVKNLCKRLNLIPACTNAHKRCHQLFSVFVHVAQTHRDESNISSVPVCDSQTLLLPVQLQRCRNVVQRNKSN